MRADAKKNYESLLAIAREVITEQGVDASLRDIARRAYAGLLRGAGEMRIPKGGPW